MSEKYEKMTDDEMIAIYTDIIKQWKCFLSSENAENLSIGKDFFIHKTNLLQVIERTNRRKSYYEYFYGDELCEYKRVAIESFWIVTLKPFTIFNEHSVLYNCPNEMFSLYRILAVIRNMYEEKCNHEEIDIINHPFEYPSDKRIQDILYDFKYCGFSREAFISFVETFADNYGVGIDYIFKRKEERSKTESTT